MSTAELERRIEQRAGEAASAWLGAATPQDRGALAQALSEVASRLGRKSLVASFKDRAAAAVAVEHGALPVGDWRSDEAGRVVLLARFAAHTARPTETLFQLYDQGDAETRVAALRALNFVSGDPEPGVRMVLDAGRTNDTRLMTAAWCNPFSGVQLSDHDHRKAVLKAFFAGVPVEGFPRLLERADAELAQSLCEYIDERLAAGRTVPPAIWAVAALHPRPGLVARLLGNLEHPNPEERLAAARALANARDPRTSSFLTERLERESDPAVCEALEAACAALEGAGQ